MSKACLYAREGVCCTRVVTVIVVCMVRVPVPLGKIVIWSTIPYTVWEVVEEVGGIPAGRTSVQ